MFWKNKKIKVGNLGEEMAGNFLKNKGFEIIQYNYQNKIGKRLGEIDIITKKDGQIVFVEVKTRIARNSVAVFPEENITRDKLRKMQKIAQNYMREKYLLQSSYRFDAVSILLDENGKDTLEIRHLESIFY